MEASVRMEGIVKRFPGALANDKVDLEIIKGEIHSLLGENGSGKTTLMNILYGLYRPDAGKIYLDGKVVEITSPKVAINHGIGMVHQNFMLTPVFSVTENIILGQPVEHEPILDLKKAEQHIAELSQAYGLSVEPEAKVWQLSVGTQQRVEIIKALYRGAKILILDEPTSVLTPSETDELFTSLRQLVNKGQTVVFISHKLNEVMAISNRVTVLRDGRTIGTVQTHETDEALLAQMMVGRKVFLNFNKPAIKPGRKILEISNLFVNNDKELPALHDITLDIKEGEIVGIAGVDGNGQTELAEAIVGLRSIEGGEICINGRQIVGCSIREIIDMGVAFIPPDRQGMGMLKDFSVSENLLLKNRAKPQFAKYMLFKLRAIQEYSKSLIKDYDIRGTGPNTKIGDLSGGNQQKVVLARELSSKPNLLIASQPTRGLDIGATEYVRGKLLEERERGAAILLISTELEEILSLSDRIIVLYKGEIMGQFLAGSVDVQEIGASMAGAKRNAIGFGATVANY